MPPGASPTVNHNIVNSSIRRLIIIYALVRYNFKLTIITEKRRYWRIFRLCFLPKINLPYANCIDNRMINIPKTYFNSLRYLLENDFSTF